MKSNVGQDTISAPVRRPAASTVVALRERDTDRRHELPMARGKIVVGKSPSCDLVLDDPFVSARHCVLERDRKGGLTVRDSSSKNGTFVDGTPVSGGELRPGATLLVGRTSLVAVGDRQPDSALAQLRGEDPVFREALRKALRAAQSDASILIVGETGTGKDLVARAIHEASRRSQGPFVPINCGAFPRELIGAELFGHVRGAFTGAADTRDGVFVRADGGTLFLDELGELPIDLQPHLLRALEARTVRPIGGADERQVDVRFVAATNRLDGLSTARSPIRFDLYHRVASVVVQMPPLRERMADLPTLVNAFLDDHAPRHGVRRLLPSAIDALLEYDWPGNVRELRQVITRAVSLTDDDIDVGDLGLEAPWLGAPPPPPAAQKRAPMRALRAGEPVGRPERRWSRPDLLERDMMAGAYQRTGSLRAAAKELDMPKSTFADRARKYGLIIDEE